MSVRGASTLRLPGGALCRHAGAAWVCAVRVDVPIRLGVLPTTESVALRSPTVLTELSASPFSSARFASCILGLS